MLKKLTITVDDEVYEGLRAMMGPRRISRILNELARRHVMGQSLAESDAAITADTAREAEEIEWAESLVIDVTGGAEDVSDAEARKERIDAVRQVIGEGREAIAAGAFWLVQTPDDEAALLDRLTRRVAGASAGED